MSLVRRAMAWSAAGVVFGRGLSIAVRLLLAGLLLPEHFGMVAMVSVLTALGGTMADAGLQQALIQRRRDGQTPVIHDSAFWFVLGSGLAWSVAVGAAGVPVMALAFDQPSIVTPGAAMAVGIALQALCTMPVVLLTRRMRFRLIVMAEIAGIVVGAALAVGLASAGAGVWSLVAQYLLTSAVTATALWRLCPWRPRPRFDALLLRSAAGYSGSILGARLVYFLRTHLDNVLVGGILGTAALGLYAMAFSLTEGVRSQLSSIFGRVMLPAYSRSQDDPAALRTHYRAMLRLTTVTVLPVCLAGVMFAEPLVGALFGPRWWPAAPVVQILSLGGVAFSLMGPCVEVLQATGRPHWVLRIALWNLVGIALPSLAWGTLQYGIEGTAAAFTMAFATQRVATDVAARRVIGLTLLPWFREIFPALLVSAAVVLGWLAARDLVPVVLQLLLHALAFLALAALHLRRGASTRRPRQ